MTQSPVISQNIVDIKIYKIMKTVGLPQVVCFKSMSCHMAIAVKTRRTYSFPDIIKICVCFILADKKINHQF